MYYALTSDIRFLYIVLNSLLSKNVADSFFRSSNVFTQNEEISSFGFCGFSFFPGETMSAIIIIFFFSSSYCEVSNSVLFDFQRYY